MKIFIYKSINKSSMLRIGIAIYTMFIFINTQAQYLVKSSYDIYPYQIKVGAENTTDYFPLIKNKRIAITANQTSVIGKIHLIDSLTKRKINIVKIFSPEHGFRGNAEAGAELANALDSSTRLPIISLYGKDKNLKASDLKDIEVMLFDIQDVGARFYTYISTLHYVMKACAENNVQLIVLDRPNPNGYYIDGPVLEKEFSSYVGMHSVPVVYGMTIGEYATMINGEGWLQTTNKCLLTVIPIKGYQHKMLYQLPVPPSPNLTNMSAIYLYPSLCFFEGTAISVGRGTYQAFRIFGNPLLKNTETTFIPKSIKGVSDNPPYMNKKCFGYDVEDFGINYLKNYRKLYLFWLIELYKNYPNKKEFFNEYFDKLAGNSSLRKHIIEGWDEDTIIASWQKDIKIFKSIRKKYLIYPDFE